MKTSVWSLVAHRLPWLMLLMISATFTSTIITHFETLLPAGCYHRVHPDADGSAGNCRRQTSVTVIRNLCAGRNRVARLAASVLLKEIGVAVVSGAALALVNFLRIIIFTPARA